MNEPRLVIEPLGPQHDRESFACGEPALDHYLRRRASQDTRRRVARVFIAAGNSPDEVAGYYTLSAASFEKDELPADVAKRLPHYPVPTVVIGRLAVSRAFQGRRLGETLLLDAINRVVRASATIAAYAVVVDAKNDAARTFYERYGFLGFASTPHRLFLPLTTFEKLFPERATPGQDRRGGGP